MPINPDRLKTGDDVWLTTYGEAIQVRILARVPRGIAYARHPALDTLEVIHPQMCKAYRTEKAALTAVLTRKHSELQRARSHVASLKAEIVTLDVARKKLP